MTTGKDSGHQSNTDDTKTNKVQPTLSELLKTKDFTTFIKQLDATGEDVANLEELSDEKQSQLIADYNVWILNGKPKPKMSTKKAEVQPIEKVYRRMDYGKEKLSYITKDGKHNGLEVTPIYGTIKDQFGKSQIDTSVKIGENKNFTINYDKTKAEKIMNTAFDTCPKPKFYFVDGSIKIGIRDPKKNFLGNFEELLTQAREGNII